MEEQNMEFLDSLKKRSLDQLIEIAAYCLMCNHVHIVVKAHPIDLIKAVKSVNTKYAMNFNRQRDRIGHVFQDR